MASIFTKIINRELPGYVLYEDDHTIAILDIFPVSNGHTLVIPKNERANIFKSDAEDIRRAYEVVREIGPKIQEVMGADGLNIVTNVGEASGQTIFHTHVHIIPRYNNDGLHPWPQKQGDQERLTEIAEQIKASL